MASSAQQGFVDPYNYAGAEAAYNSARGFGENSGQSMGWTGETGLPGLLGKLVGYDSDMKKQLAVTQAQQDYERASIQSARAWSEYMDNTQYQRRVADLKKAGLNPWLAVQNGISGSGTPSVDTGGSAKNQTHSDQTTSFLGMIFTALAKMFS